MFLKGKMWCLDWLEQAWLCSAARVNGNLSIWVLRVKGTIGAAPEACSYLPSPGPRMAPSILNSASGRAQMTVVLFLIFPHGYALPPGCTVWFSCLVVSSQQIGLDGWNVLHHVFRGSTHSSKLLFLGWGYWPGGIVLD